MENAVDAVRRLSATNDQLASALANVTAGRELPGHPETRESADSLASRRNYLCRKGCHREGGVDKRLIALVGQGVVCGILLVTAVTQIALNAPNKEIWYAMITYVLGLYSPSSKRIAE